MLYLKEKTKILKKIIITSKVFKFLSHIYHFIILWSLLILDILAISLSILHSYITNEFFIIWIVLFAALFVVAILSLLFFKKLSIKFLFEAHVIIYILSLITILPSLQLNGLDHGFYIFLGFWTSMIITISYIEAINCEVISILCLCINFSLFYVLLILTACNVFGLCCSIIIFIIQLSYLLTEEIRIKTSINEKIDDDPLWKNIIRSMFSGIVFLIKVKSLKGELVNLSSDDKTNMFTQMENGNYSSLEKYFDLALINNKGREINLKTLKDCLEFALRDFEVYKIIKHECSSNHNSSSNIFQMNPELDLDDLNDHKKLLSKGDTTLIREDSPTFSVLNFLKASIIRSNSENQKNTNNSISLGNDLLLNFGKLICHGKMNYSKQMNYNLTVSEFVDKTTLKNEGTFIMFEFIERNEEVTNLKEIYNFKDQMLANVAHDLRSPINGILSFIDLSIEAKEEKERLKNLEYAKISGNLLLNLVSDILDFSVIRDGKLNIQIKPFSLKDLIDEVVNLMTLQAQMKNLQIIIDNEIDSSFYLQSDRRRLSQLLINLLGNSIKFTHKGSIQLKIRKTAYKNVIRIEIKDTGIGIKPEILPQLFRPFATFDTEKGLNKYGIGLGLNICKMIVGLLGPCDSLFVSSEYHRGTKFGFLLFTNIKEKTVISSKSRNNNESNDIDYKTKVIFHEYNSYGMLSKGSNTSIGRRKIRPSTMFPLNKLMKYKSVKTGEFKNFGKRKVKSDTELQKAENRDNTLFLRKFQSDDISENLPLGSNINPLDYFSNYGSEGKVFDGIMENKRNSKKNRSCEIPSLVDRKMKSISSFSEINDEFDMNESPLMLINSRQNNRIKLMKRNSFKIIEKAKILKKKMVSTQDFNLLFREKQRKINLNILLVDDNPFNILILTEYLKKLKGYNLNILTAHNGAMALEIFELQNKESSINPIDMILMDCQMPILDGYETAKAIRDLINENQYHMTFIIAITAYQDEKKCLDAGMNSFLMKPVNEKDFLDAIKIWLN